MCDMYSVCIHICAAHACNMHQPLAQPSATSNATKPSRLRLQPLPTAGGRCFARGDCVAAASKASGKQGFGVFEGVSWESVPSPSQMVFFNVVSCTSWI